MIYCHCALRLSEPDCGRIVADCLICVLESRAPIVESHRRQCTVDLRVEPSIRVRSVIRSAGPRTSRAPGLSNAGWTRVDVPASHHRIEFPLCLSSDERGEIELVNVH